MSVLTIRRAGDPVLKEKARPVPKVTKNIRLLLDDMAHTMREADGVGLAAPQVGVSLRVIVLDVGEGLIELINPEIVCSDGSETCSEGCLSVPGFYGDVERFTSVTVEGLNREGKVLSLQGEGLLARALQHEIDHLEGILFIERAKTLRKKELEE